MKYLAHQTKALTLSLLFLFITTTLLSQTYGKNGMVVSSNKLSSNVGVSVLKKGGNAIDAAVATAFSLAVTLPSAGNIGGGGFIVFMDADGEATTIDFREKAPLAATEDMYLHENGDVVYSRRRTELTAVGVPGTVAGLYKAHQKYGKLPWNELVDPAVQQAKNGFEFNWSLNRAAENFSDTVYPFMANYFLNDKKVRVKPTEIWKQPALANTLSIIRDQGKDGFYKGKVAKIIANHMKENGGIITEEDLAKYEAIERKPMKGTYKGYDIYSMPPPSSGGVALIEMMNMMELVDFEKVEFNSTEYVHIMAEAMRRAFADRAEHLGDPDFNLDMPLDKLTSKEHAQNRFDNLDMQKASVSDPTKYGQIYDGDNTTHISIMDKDGNAVSLTYTLESSYGSKTGIPELGFIFNNEMGDFNPQKGVTTTTGQIGSAANLIKPEKRMLSSMTPTIVGKDGKPYLVIGSPGGRTIINTVFQTVLNVLEFEMPIDRAIENMKVHHQWLPDVLTYEKDLLSPDTRKALEAMGHKTRSRTRLGVLMGITYDSENKIITGAADTVRPDGGAVGY
ncbi:gamma-glutamyltransferase [Urechidicola vernalis]|uniref:Glutathione hydrolase proenzyme n=1 Tax=Urechidicola vernalis TaxID=3075600 RepID=A0ABU2Y8D6_9FLAO|nr:gamma-glutamyltransferase [Urechidicola sp. P050]MDT0554070.1 gamma-glutamyltransferase [Urechidicola sp. P050]